jgi:SAM-dependent methyltransferase
MGGLSVAITRVDVEMWRKLRDEKKLPLKPTILEIGEANWYGDYPLSGLIADVKKCKDEQKYEVRREMATLFEKTGNLTIEETFLAAKYFYELIMNFSRIGTIDLNGTEGASKVDLNYPIQNNILFDVVINTGTLEHIFDIAQCFRTIHGNCAPNGLMYHVFPMRGWLDHGFYNINPTLLVDLAAIGIKSRLAVWELSALNLKLFGLIIL